MISLLAMSFGDRYCFSTKDRTGGGGWYAWRCKQHGCIWIRLKKQLGWHWEGNFCPFWH